MKTKFLRIALSSVLLIIPSLVYGQTLGTNTQIPEAACTAGTSNTELLCANSADHQLATNPNNTTLENLPRTIYQSTVYTNATTSFTNVTGITFPVNLNGNYHATCHIIWQASQPTAGPKYEFTGPNGSALTMFSSLLSPTNFTAFQTTTAPTYSTAMANTGTIGAVGTNFTDSIEFTLINGANTGNVQLLAAANGTGTLTIQPGSNCVVQ